MSTASGPGQEPAPASSPEPALLDRRVALLWLAVSTVIWGSAFFAVKAGVEAARRAIAAVAPAGAGAEAHAPAVFILARFALAAAILAFFPGAARELVRSRRARADSLKIAVWFALGFALQVYGLVETTATASAFLTSSYVLFVPLIVLAATGTRPPLRLAAGVLVALAGLALLTGDGHPGAGGEALRFRFGRGEVLSLLCSVAFAVQVWLTDIYTRRTGAAALTLGTLAFTVALGGGALATTAAGRAALSPAVLAALLESREVVLSVVYTAVGATVVALYLMYRYQRAVSPTRATIVYAIEPAAAAAFACTFAGERLTAAGWAGCGLILAGNLIAELRPRVTSARGPATDIGRAQ